ncbi:hypothetical protein D9V37_12945 [Nocardioides mangrovicus]|uniref:Uncharacterized protein n=1 Tax=Nocardioides mangrovicus TaxID=2478913 RepID=A0A3L8P144_9ACTN|nr:hypothetical protein [Nocardioides mangrovicus]RLV48647.1 hypothetical protein D9V37_12945 [Nocardioides mangrovicus]
MTSRSVLTAAAVVLAGLAVLGMVLLGASLLHHDDARPRAATATASSSASALPTRALGETSAPATATPTPVLPSAQDMKNFLVQYLDTATADQASAWQALTPAFQAASGGFGSYRAFWGDITRADPSDITVSPVDGVVAYRVTYTHRDGRVTTDATRLRLVQADGVLKIDAEAR